MTENEEPESITKGNGPLPSIHALTSSTAPTSMRTILTGRTGGRPIACWESAHPAGATRRDDPTTVDTEVFCPVVAARENPVVDATTRIADAIKIERNTTSVLLVNVPGVSSEQDCYRRPPGDQGPVGAPGPKPGSTLRGPIGWLIVGVALAPERLRTTPRAERCP
jgi:hypothetical protein